MNVLRKEEKKCINDIWNHYRTMGRHDLPWRKTRDPYRILVSEVMLQQTQVSRVVEKYKSFLKRFPTARALAHAPLGEVIREWQGLGYNRRARMLHETAKCIVGERRGIFPSTYEELIALPGVGPYTAGAVMAFAWGKAIPLVETNIRTIIIHHFFNDEVDVHDREVIAQVARILDEKRGREWYYAMMDYGAYLKRTIGNVNVRSRHHATQKPFRGSDREIRGALIKNLLQNPKTRKSLHKELPFDAVRIDAQLMRLVAEGMLLKQASRFTLAS